MGQVPDRGGRAYEVKFSRQEFNHGIVMDNINFILARTTSARDALLAET